MATKIFTPYKHQAEAIEAIKQKRETKGGRALVVIPTGGGKTFIATDEARREIANGGKVLILAHREKLLKQMRKELLLFDPEADIGIVGFGYSQWGHKYTLGGVQTLYRSPERLKRLLSEKITYVTTDEAHHILSPGYQLIHKHLPDAFFLGITATTDRGDGGDAADFYGPAVYTASIRELIKAGHLCDLITFVIKTKTDISNVHLNSKKTEYIQQELEYVLNCEDRNALIANSCLDPLLGGPDLPTVAFCAGRDHARNLAEAYNSIGITARPLLGDTEDEQREEIYRDFASGKLKVITNVDVCSEGWDADVRRVILAAPTHVRSRHAQRIGRGTRNAPGKDVCYILDFSDDVVSHDMEPVSLSEVFEMQVENGELLTEAAVKDLERKAIEERDEKVREEILVEMREYMQLVNKEVDILGTKLNWNRLESGGYIVKVQDSKLFIVPGNGPALFNAAMRFKRSNDDSDHDEVLCRKMPLAFAMATVEQKAKQIQAGAYELADPDAAWKRKPLSRKQLQTLEKLQRAGKIDRGIPLSILSQREADRIMNSCNANAKVKTATRTRKPRKKKVS